jgi:uncharacterized membrane protein YfcA
MNKAVHNKKLSPVFLRVEQSAVLLIGGGSQAWHQLKILLLQSPAAEVTIVAEELSEEIRRLVAAHPACTILQRAFEPADLENKAMVILATDDSSVEELVKGLAREHDFLIQLNEAAGFPVFPPDLRSKNDYAAGSAKNGASRDIVEIEYGKRWRKIAMNSLLAFAFMLIGHFIFSYLPLEQMADDAADWYRISGNEFLVVLLAGFVAQLVDGALGMGYGVTSATILLSAGVNPAAMSGSIHTAEMFASGASGYSHYKFGNVNKKLFWALVIPGVLGAIAGAILLVTAGERYGGYIKPMIAAYTLFLGVKFIITAFREKKKQGKFKHYRLLAAVGGFFDSFAGGGWGPIVTTTLINKGRSHKYVVGSVSLTEFFVTLGSAFTFFTMIGVSHWQTILGLLIGGVVASPIAAKLAGKLPRKLSFILLGALVIFWSMRILIKMI